MLVQDFLEHSARERPDKVALVSDGGRWTYGELEAQANRLAQALRAQGLPSGGRVVLHLPNCQAGVVGIFATLKAGGTFVVVNHSTKADKLQYILNNCQASVLVADPAVLRPDALRQVLGGTPSLKLGVLCGTIPELGPLGFPVRTFESLQAEFPAEPLPRTARPEDLACLIYTSGSTGQPKGVMSEHRQVVFASGSIIQYLENVESDVVINALPLSFDYGLYQLLMVFRFGGKLVLERSFAFPAAVLKQIAQEQVTGFPGVPTMFALLLQMDLSAFNLSSLRYITNTAAALPPSHIAQLQAKFPHVRIFSMYGLTETKRTLYLPPDQLGKRPGSVGIAIPGTEVWIEDDSGRRLGPGEVGELVIRGQHVMRGYWGDPELSAKRFRPGPKPGERLCYSGDLFRMDEDGYLYFVGRKDDIIKSRGEKVAPKEVEGVLYGLPGVVEVAVIGVPDPVLGQAIKAILVANNPHLTVPQVLAHCRAHLEDFMVPQLVEFRESLPKTASGKIQRTALT